MSDCLDGSIRRLGLRANKRSLLFGKTRITNANRNLRIDYRPDHLRMHHARAKNSEFFRFFVRELWDRTRVAYEVRVCGLNTIDVRPNLYLARVESRADQRRRVIRTTTPERCRNTFSRCANKPAEHRNAS